MISSANENGKRFVTLASINRKAVLIYRLKKSANPSLKQEIVYIIKDIASKIKANLNILGVFSYFGGTGHHLCLSSEVFSPKSLAVME